MRPLQLLLATFPLVLAEQVLFFKFAARVPEEYPNCLLGKLLAR